MNHKVILKQVQESSVSFVGVSVNFEIRSAPCFAHPLVVIILEVFSCLGLEELGHQKKWKLFLQELFHLSEGGGLRFACIRWLQPFTKLFLPLTLFLVSTSFFFVPYSTHLLFIFIWSSISGCYLWEPSCLFLQYPTPLYCCSSLHC